MRAIDKALLAWCALIMGCTADTDPTSQSTHSKLIEQLEQSASGSVLMRVDINGRQDALIASAATEVTRLEIPAALLVSGNNSLDINLVLQKPNLAQVSLATASREFSYSGNAATITLQGTDYRYPDDDGDSIPNLLELLIAPADIDNDGVDNLLDRDSDADGVEDGDDAHPYGPPGANNELAAIVTIEMVQRAQVAQRISVTRIVGSGITASTLDTAINPLTLLEPINWPWSLPVDLSPSHWKLIELPITDPTLCPQTSTSIDIDTSSLLASTSRPIIGYFERFDGTAFSVPIESGSIRDLSAFNRSDNGSGNTSLDNALRALLIPANTVGFISLWTRDGFNGEQCQLNLATANTP